MPKGPNGEKRPGDTVQAAIQVAKIATGEIEEAVPDADKRKAGQAGGKARVERAREGALSHKQ